MSNRNKQIFRTRIDRTAHIVSLINFAIRNIYKKRMPCMLFLYRILVIILHGKVLQQILYRFYQTPI